MLPVIDIPSNIQDETYSSTKHYIEQVVTTKSLHDHASLLYDYGKRKVQPEYSYDPHSSTLFLKVIPNTEQKLTTLLGTSVFGEYDNRLSDEDIDRFGLLLWSFKKELSRIKGKLQVDQNSAGYAFSFLSTFIYRLPFDKCAFELNSNNTMKLSLTFKDDKLLMLTKPLEGYTGLLSDNEVVYSFFISRKLVASDSIPLHVFAKRFSEYIKM